MSKATKKTQDTDVVDAALSGSESKTTQILRGVLGLAVISVVAYIVVFYRQYLTITFFAKNYHVIESWVAENFVQAAAGYIGVMSMVIGLTVPGATFLSFAGGILFPQPYAALCAFGGYIIGAQFSFLIVSFVLRDFCRKRLKGGKGKFSNSFEKFEKNVQSNAFVYLIIARYTFIFPFWFVNAVSAIVGVKFRVFSVATMISVIPGSIVYTCAGRSLGNIMQNIDPDTAGDIDLRKLVFETLMDPNVAACLVGVVFCLGIVAVLAKYNKGNEQADKKSPSKSEFTGNLEKKRGRSGSRGRNRRNTSKVDN